MKRNIIGREREIKILEKAIGSEKSELIAVYGRRRVGKTFLIKEYFNENFDFYATGLYEGRQKDELKAFCEGLKEKGIVSKTEIKTWMDAFILLRDYLKTIKKKRIIVFLDELPWFDVPPGQFLKAFEWFWNSWGSTKKGLKFIVCGSSTSWMIHKFISNKGGLYNRTTTRLYLAPFSLHDTEAYLKNNGFRWNRLLILETYMTFGGIPFYLNLLDTSLSLAENIDRLFFHNDAPLRHEYQFLMQSLFKDAKYYSNILECIARKNKGVTRKEITESKSIESNGALSTALNTLILSDFIRKYNSYGKKQRDALYQLTDPFILFYKRFVENNNSKEEHFWQHSYNSPSVNTWKGIAFEEVCLLHLNQINKGLGINGVLTESGCWYYPGNDSWPPVQIDLVIKRADKVVNLCEIKYSEKPYLPTAKLYKQLENQRMVFENVISGPHAVIQSLITPFGMLRKNEWAGAIHNVITLDHLFEKL